MFEELDVVKLTHNIAEYGLKEGDIGAIVNVYNNGEAYEVEFVAPDGRTIALLTLDSSDLSSRKHSPIHTWSGSVSLWSGLKQPLFYPIKSNSYGTGTEQFSYPQL